jgi:DNA-binding transcriptional MerR regulator
LAQLEIPKRFNELTGTLRQFAPALPARFFRFGPCVSTYAPTARWQQSGGTPAESIRWSTLMSNISRCKRPHDPNVVQAEPEQPAYLTTVDSTELSAAQLAHLWGVTLRALRFYEARGLISPRREGRMRVYNQVDSHRVGLILRAKKLGFTLADIGRMIDVKDGAPASRGLQLTAEKCLQQITHLERQMKTIFEALADLRRIHLALCREAANQADGTSTSA